MTQSTIFDTIIIGGSYAGLSTAMSLGRSIRNTLIIDAGQPCNRQTPHSQNFLTRDGQTPHEIASIARKQVLQYPTITFSEGLVVDAYKTEAGFDVITDSGQTFRARTLVLATGIKDILPDIKGFRECWGISVVHCPYCHGYEYRNQKTGILANGERAMHLIPMVFNLSQNLTALTGSKPDFAPEQFEKLLSRNIRVIEQLVREIVHRDGRLSHIILADGTEESFDALYAAIAFEHHTNLHERLGCMLTDQGYIKIDGMQKTTVSGVYACGDTTSPLRSLANAIASGSFTGAAINRELVLADF